MTQLKHEIEKGKSQWLSVILLGLSVFFLVSLSGPAAQLAKAENITRGNLARKIAEAKTPADHLEIASYYRTLAIKSAEEASYHEGTVKAYEGPKKDLNYSKMLVDHCRNLAWSYRYMQKEYESMAEEHSRIAEELGKKKE